ncbi:hypothetical protein [Streptomyces sp. 5-10]|uniref:hypothetical protein n=1 Tax=Streptomyces sp. 5-10 TaxID=878925 RepID=UPI00168C0B2E|nr:hypothetical protein [Streptomyces sp. 5-10]MBD3004834.1 hypothetical protein [Streptomyces sp. 5-10]
MPAKNKHYTSPKNPVYVTGAERYRLPLVGYLTPKEPKFDTMVKWLNLGDKNLHTRPEGYGLIFLESEEHSATYFGPIEQVQQYQRENTNGTATFDQSQGVTVALWPHGDGWDDLIPDTTWTPDGKGVVTSFPHPVVKEAEVIVYEFHGSWLPDGPTEKLITYHCTACHQDMRHSGGDTHENKGPHDRRWVAQLARKHVRSAELYGMNRDGKSACCPHDPDMIRVVTEVANEKFGTNNPVLSEDSWCAVNGQCAMIREVRAAQAVSR